jgi:hypothetical protein
MGTWLSIAVTVILIAVAYVILNRNITARTSQQAALDEIKREVGAVLTELNAASERNVELIEDRITTLERLVEQADRRISVLRREVERDQEITYQRPVPRPQAPVPAEDQRRTGPVSAEYGTIDRAPPAEPVEESGDAASRIERLYLQGFPLERIASIVGRSLGEVELIISLREGTDR